MQTSGKIKEEFLDLVFNEKFQSLREMEPVLGEVFRLLINNEKNSLTVLPLFKELKGVYLRRAGYILDFTRRLSDYEPPDIGKTLNEAKKIVDSTTEGKGLPFFHKEKPLPPEFLFDDLAKYWGLSKGIPLQRLLQMLKPPYVC